MAQRRTTVSYTHLDVYKRQPFNMASLSPDVPLLLSRSPLLSINSTRFLTEIRTLGFSIFSLPAAAGIPVRQLFFFHAIPGLYHKI